jgi:outer-membrane receptor for ferric coprogen and ferric-rhodotorulic acid
MQRARSAQPVVRASAVAVAIGAMLMTLAPPAALAQTAAVAPAAAAREFDIASGTLASALIRFGEQAGVQFTVAASLTANKQSPALKGRFTPEQGLRALLSGSGLAFRFATPQTVVIEAAPQGDRVLGPVRIEGVTATAGSGGSGWGVGPNGSSDATATEGSNSFAAAALTIGGKTAHSIKDTPQSVSVVTMKQIDEQHLDSITEVMNQTPGVTVVTRNSSLEGPFYARGFAIEKGTIDGGAAFNLVDGTLGMSVRGDLAAVYDHVEVLRGADGIFAGFGQPGGSINLVRKKPLDHTQIVFDASAGSWSNYRTALECDRAADPGRPATRPRRPGVAGPEALLRLRDRRYAHLVRDPRVRRDAEPVVGAGRQHHAHALQAFRRRPAGGLEGGGPAT